MGYDFSGTDQSLGNDGGLTGIDVNQFSVLLTMAVDALSAPPNTPFNTTAAFAAGGSRFAINVNSPVAAGNFIVRLFYDWTTIDGTWRTGDYTFGQILRMAATYDRGATTNDPRLWVNGSEVTLTELTAPAGSAATGVDGVRIGENASGGQDFNGQLYELALYSRILADDEAVAYTKGYSPLRMLRGLEHHWDLIRNLTDRRKGGVLSATGTPTVVPHVGMIYPRNHQSLRIVPAPVGGHPGIHALVSPTTEGGLMFLRQSTTITIRMGPALDKTDGVTEETALSPIVEVSKNNGAFAARSSATAITHDSNGWYAVELNTTDTNTVGWLIAKFDDVATHLPVWHEFWVLEEAIYDALFAASAAGFDANADVTVGGFAAGAITAAAIAADAITAARWRLMYPPR